MPPKKNNSKLSVIQKFRDNPIGMVFGAFMGVASLFGIGFTVGQFYKDNEYKMEKIKLEQEYQAKIQEQINKCRELKDAENERRVNDMLELVQELQKKVYDKR